MQTLTSRQEEIVTTSIEIIASEGVQHLTIKNIAQHIGISEAAIYRHFKSKMDILLAILSNFKETSREAIKTAVSGNSSYIDQMELIFFTHLKIFSETPSLASVIFSEEIFQNDERLANEVYTLMQANYTRIVEIIKKGQQQEEIRTDISEEQIATITMGALRLQVNKWKLSGFSFNLKDEGEKLWKTIRKLITKKQD
ncbi:MAG: TetR/AcrR family transcriptional regulator [Spirochaetes bacterium]|nr:TetR/AcrR family transcriptional regulator [Spirochaetota bacterium]